jgi:hypothetical protein
MLQKACKKLPDEAPAEELRRHLVAIAGTKRPDENNKSMLSRVYRRLALDDLTHRTLESYWRGTVRDVPSHHMDRARELAFVQPIQEAEDAITTAEAFLAGLRARLEGSLGTPARRVGAGHPLRRATDRPQREVAGRPGASHLDQALTIARHTT